MAVSTDAKKEHAGFVKMEVVKKLNQDNVSKFVRENIEPCSKIQTDALNIYNALADLGVEHEQYPLVSGEKPLPWVHIIINDYRIRAR